MSSSKYTDDENQQHIRGFLDGIRKVITKRKDKGKIKGCQDLPKSSPCLYWKLCSLPNRQAAIAQYFAANEFTD